MFVRMLAYAGRTPNTEGYITRRVCLTRLGIDERPEVGPESAPETRLERLQEVGLVEEREDGYQIVSWLRWNRSVEEMGNERAQDRARKASVTRESPETGPESDPESGQTSGSGSTGQIQIQIRSDTDQTKAIDIQFAEFWAVYPKKVGKGQAVTAWKKAAKKEAAEVIIAAASVYAASVKGKDQQFTANPSTWLNGERWSDEVGSVVRDPGSMTNEQLWA
jgi:hypothetical protein